MDPELVQRILGHAAVAAIVAVGVFFVSAPYAFIDFGNFVSDLLAQSNMARNAGLWPFTVQYIDTPPFIYQIRQSALWGLGLPLGIVAWLAVPFTLAMVFWRRLTLRADLLVLAWVVPSFLLLESFEVRFLRYVFPIMPFLILMGSRMLLWTVDWARQLPATQNAAITEREIPPVLPLQRGVGGILSREGLAARFVYLRRRFGTLTRRRRTMTASQGVQTFKGNLVWLPVGLVVIILAATAFYALAFQRVYAKDHPAVEASQWIKDNVPAGSAIVSDNHWDEFVPDLYRYQVWQFPLYEADTPDKMDTLASHLAESDFLVFYSNRPYSSAARDPKRFPLSTAYYQRLFGSGICVSSQGRAHKL